MEAPTATRPGTDETSARIASALRRFAPVALDDMNSVSLMRRIDTKYVLHRAQLPSVLAAVEDHYSVLEIEGRRAMSYASQYFDTAECRFFNDHHNGRAGRIKVRIRSYVDSGVSFLEVKRKTVQGVTNKRRVRLESPAAEVSQLTPDAREFLDIAAGDADDLMPTVRNRFRRITLVNVDRGERATIDWDISSHLPSVDYAHANLVIVEVKQGGLDRHAPIMKELKAFGARPYRVSKYCLGMTRLCPHLKSNRFKQKLLRIDKVTKEARH